MIIQNTYDENGQIVVCGIPDEDHNCDAMGCSSVEHVLYRFDKSKDCRCSEIPALEAKVKELELKLALQNQAIDACVELKEENAELRKALEEIAELLKEKQKAGKKFNAYDMKIYRQTLVLNGIDSKQEDVCEWKKINGGIKTSCDHAGISFDFKYCAWCGKKIKEK